VPQPASLRAALGLAAGLLAAGALLAWAGPAAIGEALAGADWRFVALAAGCYVAVFALRGVRWSLLLGRPGAAPSAALLTATGWMVSTFVPLKAGDVVRAAWMARRHGVPFAATAGTVAVERALDLLGLAAAASASLLALALAGTAVPSLLRDVLLVAWILPLAGFALLTAVASAMPAERRGGRVLRFAGQLADQVPRLAGQPRLLAASLGLTAVAVAAQCGVYVAFVLAVVPGATPFAAMAGAPLFLLSFGIALTPGHLGTYEAAFALVFSVVGLGTAAALLPLGLAVHLLAMATVAALGGLALVLLWASPGPAPHPATPLGEAAP
jgi:uncharacterized membrane protein YbhN (UPF0104 family)